MAKKPKSFRVTRKQEGGLATSIHTDPATRERDMEFLNTRNERLREVAGLRSLAVGGRAKRKAKK